MENLGKFLIVGEKLFFTLIHKNSRHRSFSYSGIFDVDCAGNGSNLVINHAGTHIIINGTGLNMLHKYLIEEKLQYAYEDEPFQDKEGKLYKISEIFYLDEKENG